MSRGQSQPTTRPLKRSLGKCKNKNVTKSVEVIDVDNGKTDFYIIDEAGTSNQGSRCLRSKTRNRCTASVICIDDDDADVGDSFTNASNDSKSNNVQPVDEESEDVQGHSLPQSNLKSPEKEKTYAECSSRNHYGLYGDTSSDSESSSSESDGYESDGSESDGSDCEIIEDVPETRQQWERAAMKRKLPKTGQHHHTDDHASAPIFTATAGFTFEDPDKNIGCAKYCTKSNYQSCSNHLEEEFNGCEQSSTPNGDKVSFTVEDENTSTVWKSKSSAANAYPCNGVDHENFDINAELNSETQFAHDWVDSSRYSNDAIFSNINVLEDFAGVENANEAQTTCHYEDSHLGKPFKAWEKGYQCTNNTFSSKEKGNSQYEQTKGQFPLPDETVIFHEAAAEVGANPLSEQNPCDNQAADKAKFKVGRACFFVDNERDGISGANGSFNNEQQSTLLAENNLIGVKHRCDGDEHTPEIQDSLIGDREKHKESDEYRRADEEEWAARQRELQIQAEEAQKQRRRRKAETLRILDMERRQKQRLEEIRQSQKKDEEIINMKENLRTEVRKELEEMESRCRDMASLLRQLGIHVGGGPFPLSHEVNAAYKQALLRFHPDRASRTDIRLQVEAEEKFKLISRLKEKLLPVS